MKISIVLDESGLDESGLDESVLDESGLDESGLDYSGQGQMTEAIEAAIASWISTCGCTAELVRSDASAQQAVGLAISTSKKAMLKKALDFLYGLAQTHKQEFVVGYIDTETSVTHKVCYFGHEEGRPDVSEIGSYLGLRR